MRTCGSAVRLPRKGSLVTTNVHYVIDGAGDGREAVLFSGSLGSDVRMWEPQVSPVVAAGMTAVRYDHRGHGESRVPAGPYSMADLGADAIALFDELGYERVHWVGLSLGGMIGLWLGQNAPERIASLSLLCTSADMPPRESWLERAALVRSEGVEAVADAVLDRWVTPGYRAANPERAQWMREMIATTSAEGYASCCAAIATMDLVPGLATITAPTLVIAGKQDPATPPAEHGQRIVDAVRGARLEIVDPGAHLANYESPEQVTPLIIDHVRSASRTGV
jgi:3-oxoadipate enol-lactonase